MPTSPLGQFLTLFTTQGISFFLIVANGRAYNQGDYFWTALTDTIISAQNFAVSILFIEHAGARSKWAGLGMTIGGTIGSLLSIYATKHLFGR